MVARNRHPKQRVGYDLIQIQHSNQDGYCIGALKTQAARQCHSAEKRAYRRTSDEINAVQVPTPSPREDRV